LDEGRKTSEKPWFLYLSYHAPHFPLHAPEDDIAKYADKYTIGWDKIREDRLIKMKRLGIIPESMSLSPLSKYWDWNEEEANTNPAWNDVASNRQKDLARRMAIYAAMIDIMDRNIGRLLLKLEKNNELENTMIIFLSDNGACAEWDPYGFDIKSGPDNKLHEEHQIEQMGGPGTYHSVGSGWANASNTPLRLYKHYNHEGGISSPLIVQWPNGIKRSGTIDHRKSHLIDLLPTLLDVAGIPYPEQFDGHKTIPIEGKSILPLLKGETMEDRTLYFEHEKNRAVISEGWKLSAVRGQSWELYDHAQDRNELFNLAEKHPDIVAKLDSLWQNWADKNFVTPHPKDFGVPYLGSVE
jgi:arylsulfatase